MDHLTELLKEKLKIVPRWQKIQILTIPAAMNWSRGKIQKEFEVCEYSLCQVQKLTKENGILSMPQIRQSRSMNAETIQLVQFYEGDEQSRLLPA